MNWVPVKERRERGWDVNGEGNWVLGDVTVFKMGNRWAAMCNRSGRQVEFNSQTAAMNRVEELEGSYKTTRTALENRLCVKFPGVVRLTTDDGGNEYRCGGNLVAQWKKGLARSYA